MNNKKGFIHITLILAIVLIGIFVVIAASKFDLPGQLNKPTQSAFPTVQITPGPQSESKIVFYEVKNNDFIELYSEKELSRRDYENAVYSENENSLYYSEDQIIKKINFNTKQKSDIHTFKTDYYISHLDLYQGNIYITFAGGNRESFHHIIEYNLSTKDMRQILGKSTYVFSGGRYLFKSSQNGDVYVISGGDGCGGGGYIEYFLNGETKVVTDHGVGCAQEPRFIGTLESKNAVLMAAIIPTSDYENMKYDVLYSQDVNTLEKTGLFDLRKITDHIDHISLSKDKSFAVVHTEKEYIVVDLNSNTVSNRFARHNKPMYNYSIVGVNKIYEFVYPEYDGIQSYASTTKGSRIIDIKTGTTTDFKTTVETSGIFQLVGWNGNNPVYSGFVYQ